MLIIICLFLIGMFVPCLSFAQITPSQIPTAPLKNISAEELNDLFDEANQHFKFTAIEKYTDEICKELNGSVLISLNNQIIVHRHVGYLRLYENPNSYPALSPEEMQTARSKNKNQISDYTLFESASISKQFTAAAILKLVEQEYLALTDTLRSFFPELPYEKVTIHHLLTHTSGIPEYFDFEVTFFPDTSVLLTNQALIELLIQKMPPADFKPGEKFYYCNTNYVLLASIVALISGKSFEQFVTEQILVPANLQNTLFRTELSAKDSSVIAKGHLRNKEEVKPIYLDGTLGDKGIYTTVTDLYLWGQQLFKGKIISENSINMAASEQNYLSGNKKATEIYGYGLRIEENKNYGKLIFHGGLWRGFQNLYIYRPSDHCYIIFLSNLRNNAHFRKSDEYFHLLDGV